MRLRSPGVDPWEVLGLDRAAATAESVRRTRRQLAKLHHPDVVAGGGGGPAAVAEAAARLTRVNQAAELALAEVAARPETPVPPPARDEVDAAFSIDLLPVDAFELILLAFSAIGDPKVIDEPYLLEGQVDDPYLGAARVELAPEAGGTIVTVTTWPISRAPTPAPTATEVAGRLLWEVGNLRGR